MTIATTQFGNQITANRLRLPFHPTSARETYTNHRRTTTSGNYNKQQNIHTSRGDTKRVRNKEENI